MIVLDKSKICQAIKELASKISYKDLKTGFKYITKIPEPTASWAISITKACLTSPSPILKAPTKSKWRSHGIRVLNVAQNKNLHESCIGKEKMNKIGEGFFGSVFTTKRQGKTVAVKIEKLSGFRLNNLNRFSKMITATRKAGEIGVGPKIHDYYICLHRGQHHSIIVMDYLKGPTWHQWADFATPTEMERATKILKDKLSALNKAGIVHNDISNPNNIIVVLKNGLLQDVVPVDYGISYFSKDADELAFEAVTARYRDNWLTGFAGHLLKNKLLDII